MWNAKVQTIKVSIPVPTPAPVLAGASVSAFLLGVIEGFYGRPWTPDQRHRLFAQMQGWGMNTYLYAPKEDLKHRRHWRQAYEGPQAASLEALIRDAHHHGVNFVYALAPGLDIVHSNEPDRAALLDKLSLVASLGARHFALLFDDIPPEMNPADAQRYAGLGEAQADVTNLAAAHLRSLGRNATLLFCPTEYCTRRAEPSVADSPYLRAIGRDLEPQIGFLWTGPEVVSPQIDVEGIRELAAVIGRKPVLWDNLHANDYAPRRVHLGPYDRVPELRAEVAGMLSNPNTPFEVNYPSLASLADYARGAAGWTARASLNRALAAWWPLLELDADSDTEFKDLALLADALYLPHTFGDLAQKLADAARTVLENRQTPEAVQRLERDHTRLERLLRGLSGAGNRELFFELHPYLIELVDELGRLRLRAVGSATAAFEPFPNAKPGSLVDQLRPKSV